MESKKVLLSAQVAEQVPALLQCTKTSCILSVISVYHTLEETKGLSLPE